MCDSIIEKFLSLTPGEVLDRVRTYPGTRLKLDYAEEGADRVATLCLLPIIKGHGYNESRGVNDDSTWSKAKGDT